MIQTTKDTESVPLRLHPRVFAALGSGLVTNDFVAITELVKNAYDAFADRVEVRFLDSAASRATIEIKDNGQGMTDRTIRDVWCVVATPHRARKPFTQKGSARRRVTGEKGLGRLSVGRLGSRLVMLTKAANSPCLELMVDWNAIAEASDLTGCEVTVRRHTGPSPFAATGTLLRVENLTTEWDDQKVDELREYLGRLISPFSGISDFEIWLSPSGHNAEPVRIESPEFLEKPKYRLSGKVDDEGNLDAKYLFRPLDDDATPRRSHIRIPWTEARASSFAPKSLAELEEPGSGPFTFEVRAWDVDANAVGEISERYSIKRAAVRSAIRAHKGISVYRDGVLVLPKSESARDWLGLDVRRISDVGKRMSTTQMVGYVAISADDNPKIRDTSDRERLANSIEVDAFEHLLRTALATLENERERDRLDKTTASQQLTNLFDDISTESLVSEISAAADRGASAKEALPLVKAFERKLEKARDEIKRRFVYYSRLATVGTIAQMLVHEVLNRTTTIYHFLSVVSDRAVELHLPAGVVQKLDRAKTSVSALDRLAKTFAPLASRTFARGKRHCVLEERIDTVLDLKEPDLSKHSIKIIRPPKGSTKVAIDPGDLDAVLLNLVDNAIYWLQRAAADAPEIQLRIGKISRPRRIIVKVHDNGPGVAEEDSEAIFWPGVTRKPDGIGMGLTVASEIVAAYDGKMALIQPGKLGGASFAFDLPLA